MRCSVNAFKTSLMGSAIEAKYHCHSVHLESVPVKSFADGNGKVEVFELIGHPLAKRCYAWIEASKDHYILALQKGPISSPEDAVAAWAALGQPVTQSLVVQSNWHAQHFLTVCTIGD